MNITIINIYLYTFILKGSLVGNKHYGNVISNSRYINGIKHQ